MIRIAIVDGYHHAQSRQTQKGTRYFQTAYCHLGRAYPEMMEIPLRNPAEAYLPGDYELSADCYRVGKFRNLELNPFELKLLPVKPAAQLKQA